VSSAAPRAWIWGAVGVLCFSFTLPLTRLADKGLDATVVGLGREVVGAVLAAALLAWRREPLPPRELWPRLAIVAGGVVVGFPLLTALALKDLGSAHAAVVVGLLPAATALAAVARGGEKPSAGFWAACGFGLAAALGFAAAQGAGIGTADVLVLGAVAAAAIAYTEGAVLARDMGGWRVICWALVLFAPFVAPVVALRAAQTGLSATPEQWLSFAYVSVFSAFLGFFPWYHGLAQGGIARIGQIQLVQPLLTLGWSALLLGETIDARTAIAALAVLASVGATQRAHVAAPAPEAT
jgi:drug/metabolite transporter (DMT)-like permease